MLTMHGYRAGTCATARSCVLGEWLVPGLLSSDVCKYSCHKYFEVKFHLFWRQAECFLAIVACKTKHGHYFHSVCVELGIKNNVEMTVPGRMGGLCTDTPVLCHWVKCLSICAFHLHRGPGTSAPWVSRGECACVWFLLVHWILVYKHLHF